ncbi:hypothetical protein B0H63DRAFT_187735 [Podospora didyma]|uniref:Uncharacterized protein n=1 Tax=Podospora didyma TaxID=330526 RepID=A0AAE0NQE4_9PEZI|nr:hypothetical protein B0H63DRAFT_187735 [Podospora didyma]
MSSKPPPAADIDTMDLPPPPYTASAPVIGTISPSSTTPTAPLTALAASSLTTHLHTLASRLRTAQQARTTDQATRDLDIITQLVPRIEEFLGAFVSSSSPTASAAELVLVPGGAVPRGWAMTGALERRRAGEFLRVVRVSDPFASLSGKSEKGGTPISPTKKSYAYAHAYDDEDGDGDGSNTTKDGEAPSSSREAGFDEWGRFDSNESYDNTNVPTASWWYFRDEAMARRLAGYLQPRANVKVERKHVQAAVVAEKKGWRWGFGGGGGGKKSAETAAPVSPGLARPGVAEMPAPDDGVSMTVRAEEIRFRRENDFGVWESLSGFGIVVTVKVRRM